MKVVQANWMASGREHRGARREILLRRVGNVFRAGRALRDRHMLECLPECGSLPGAGAIENSSAADACLLFRLLFNAKGSGRVNWPPPIDLLVPSFQLLTP